MQGRGYFVVAGSKACSSSQDFAQMHPAAVSHGPSDRVSAHIRVNYCAVRCTIERMYFVAHACGGRAKYLQRVGFPSKAERRTRFINLLRRTRLDNFAFRGLSPQSPLLLIVKFPGANA